MDVQADDSMNDDEKTKFSKEEWQERLDKQSINREYIADEPYDNEMNVLNSLVMDYLIVEGFTDAAEQLAEETGTEPSTDLSATTDRMRVRVHMERGEIQKAIELVNDMDPEILDTNPSLYFTLRQQQLIELIKNNKTHKALLYARDIAQDIKEEHLCVLEQTLTLLAYSNTHKHTSPVCELLTRSKRQQTASELNKAILAATNQHDEPNLHTLMRLLLHTQQQLCAAAEFPHTHM